MPQLNSQDLKKIEHLLYGLNYEVSLRLYGLMCSGQVFPDTNLGCSAITGDNPALKLCGRLWL
jgi:hypothetical protein